MGHRVEAHDRHAGHQFDPGADEGFAGAHGDRAGRHVHGLHRRAAEPVDGRGRGALRQPGQEADQARDVQSLLALGEGAADDHVLDRLRVDPGALDQRRRSTWAASSSGRTRARLPLWAGWNGERA